MLNQSELRLMSDDDRNNAIIDHYMSVSKPFANEVEGYLLASKYQTCSHSEACSYLLEDSLTYLDMMTDYGYEVAEVIKCYHHSIHNWRLTDYKYNA